ncbi:DUF4251 domain-containing protein [Robiginitalea sp. SC105]|uniref:DUF4251 domain-containing protein n=1 Tax=Robiginitalea sp. SC105 TaxID=2762332 RepID=UPI00163A40CC|nr:DUF4251 domain-containing protein [Robiginitalea sp. SC105]MBC2840533.1 DUF4251 domain-containing protein [Robiginitalea sp. SC105]
MKRLNRNFVFVILYGVWVAAIVMLLGSCQAAAPVSAEQQANFDRMVEGKALYFEVEHVQPLSAQAAPIRSGSRYRINVTGEGYYLSLQGDSLETYLPYFGQRYNVSDYQNRSGIELNTSADDYQVARTNKGYRMEFFGQEGYERFRMLLNVLPNGRAELSVFSPQRNVIRFSGNIREIPERS